MARIIDDPAYGEEAVLKIEGTGMELRTNAGNVGDPTFGCEYVRVVDEDGYENGYWTHEEWAEEPQVVMGAILGSLDGTVLFRLIYWVCDTCGHVWPENRPIGDDPVKCESCGNVHLDGYSDHASAEERSEEVLGAKS